MADEKNKQDIKPVQDRLEVLYAEQKRNFAQVQRSIDYVVTLPNTHRVAPLLASRRAYLNTAWQECIDADKEIQRLALLVNQSHRSYFKDDLFVTTEVNYLSATDQLSVWEHALPPREVTTQAPALQQQHAASTNVKLPRLSIPTFSGKYTQWATFKSSFETLVKNNPTLQDIEKLHYLKANVQGEANELICNVELIDGNFETAWRLLENRFTNTRAAVNAHLAEMFKSETLKTESAANLLQLRNTIRRNLDALKNLGCPTESYNAILVYLLSEKLDKRTQRDWETSIAATSEIPTFDTFDTFLVERIRVLESINHAEPVSKNSQSQVKSNQGQTNSKSKQSINNSVATQPKNHCIKCEQDHKTAQCPKFNELTVSQRFEYVKSHQLCSNCLGKGHRWSACSSKFLCRQCGQKHHTLLHRIPPPAEAGSNSSHATQRGDTQQSESVKGQVSLSNQIKSSTVLLATIKVWIMSESNRKIHVRALLDQGSTCSIVSAKVAKMLGARRIHISASMSGVGGISTGVVSSAINLQILDPNDNVFLRTQALVLPKITSYSPTITSSIANWPHLTNLSLADDPTSQEEIQLLIGADLYGAVLVNEIRKGAVGEPIAQKTLFGWVISGPVGSDTTVTSQVIPVHQTVLFPDLNESIRKFWEIEKVPSKVVHSPEDELCEAYFASTHSRATDGRYIVRLPFKSNTPPVIGESKYLADKCLKRIESALAKNPMHKQMYVDFMSEYKQLGHMSQMNEQSFKQTPLVFLPHHPVFRESSQTTKLRVVFNASCKTSNGTSLNDHLVTGPKLQAELYVVLSQWRSYPFVFVADVAKMYRQIIVDPRDRKYQCIVWRDSPNLPIRGYQLNTVTYGTRPAPNLALTVLKQLVIDEGNAFPLASTVLLQDTFVDDHVFGAFTRETAITVRNELIELLGKAKFEPRKWASNDASLLSDIDPSDHGLAWDPLCPNENALKVLGIKWLPNADVFQFSINIECPQTITKRTALSLLSQLFDPLGWVAPVIVRGKILMQKLWLIAADWDQPLAHEHSVQWLNYFSSLNSLSTASIPRWNGLHPSNRDHQLHGFADASNDAYGAVVYLRSVQESGRVIVSLIVSKTKVAPLKPLKIHRLELQAAHLLAQLIAALREVRAFAELPVQCWTDSSITLAWLRKHASNWKLFVSNRVAEIHELLPRHSWRHVPTLSNPADLASRGVSAQDLVKSILWWQGPTWLQSEPESWPNAFPAPPSDDELEVKSTSHHVIPISPHPLSYVANKFSSWPKAVRITAYVLRCVDNINVKANARRSCDVPFGPSLKDALTARDLTQATFALYRYLQETMFPDELKSLSQQTQISRKSRLVSLNPMYDEANRVLRVGGRLSNSELEYGQKHPVLLAAHPLVTALIRQVHLDCLHGGTKLTLGTLRQTVWLLQPRALVKSVIAKCVVCTRLRAKLMSQLMADLPKRRITRETRAFTHCGVDYAGPLQVRVASGRGHKAHSCYIAVFVCFVVKAIHLELVSDYSSSKFIDAYKRFVARRGIPAHIYSDCGTTFQGANRVLHENFVQATAHPDFQALLARDNVQWRFNPPAAPHFGGLWEAGVKSMKHHLKRVLLNHTPTYEELTTSLCQIEAVLNSRPLEPITDDIDDLNPLTPGHFLSGGPLNAVPQRSLLDLKTSRLSRWQARQQQFEQFWEGWSRDYLQSLQSRTKWRLPQMSLKPGHMVLLKSPSLPPGKWSLARVLECHIGKDGHVRVVKIKTSTSEYLRPICELVLLPIDLESEHSHE